MSGASFRFRKLTAAQRLLIFDQVQQGYTRSHLAGIYGVTKQRIAQIANADESKIALWEKIANLPDLSPKDE